MSQQQSPQTAPSLPFSLFPHAQSVPSDLMATVWELLADTNAQFESIPIWVGVSVFPDMVPRPVRPCVLLPHAQSVPSVFMATV
jgi:hypothetical protein